MKPNTNGATTVVAMEKDTSSRSWTCPTYAYVITHIPYKAKASLPIIDSPHHLLQLLRLLPHSLPHHLSAEARSPLGPPWLFLLRWLGPEVDWTGPRNKDRPAEHPRVGPPPSIKGMATASLFAALLRRSRPRNPSAPTLRTSPFALLGSSRPFSSGPPRSEVVAVEEETAAFEDNLRRRIFRLRLPKRSATDALDRWAGEGRTVTASELRQITKDLMRSQRYKHALEVRFYPTFRVNPNLEFLSGLNHGGV
ncbi:hypothetical protein GW17_00008325 [Ensete ventricosum]|nr:hypothetical protein GW17_00008325 [Ensete ventricosum]